MANRSNSDLFAEMSYYLAIASTLIMVLTFAIGMTRVEALSPLRNLIWLVLITSGVGLFMGLAARSDFKRAPPAAELVRFQKIGVRVNAAALVFMLMLSAIVIAMALSPSIGP